MKIKTVFNIPYGIINGQELSNNDMSLEHYFLYENCSAKRIVFYLKDCMEETEDGSEVGYKVIVKTGMQNGIPVKNVEVISSTMDILDEDYELSIATDIYDSPIMPSYSISAESKERLEAIFGNF